MYCPYVFFFGCHMVTFSVVREGTFYFRAVYKMRGSYSIKNIYVWWEEARLEIVYIFIFYLNEHSKWWNVFCHRSQTCMYSYRLNFLSHSIPCIFLFPLRPLFFTYHIYWVTYFWSPWFLMKNSLSSCFFPYK